MDGNGFTGFRKDAGIFLRELSAHNDRNWFSANKYRYDEFIFEPAARFVVELGTLLKTVYPDICFSTLKNGSGSIMRIHRDVRFSPNKKPYKENLGVIFWIGEGKKVELPCFYFHLDKASIFFYGGQHMFPKEIMERYRRAVDDDKKGGALEKILGKLADDQLNLMEEPAYKRVPRGFRPDHPRAGLLRLGGIGAGLDISPKDASDGGLVGLCFGYARRMKPLIEWLKPLNGQQ